MISHYYCPCCQRRVPRSMQSMTAGWAIFVLLLGLMTGGLAWLLFAGALLPKRARCPICTSHLVWTREVT